MGNKRMSSPMTTTTLLVSSLACLVSGSSSKRGIGLVPDNWSDPSNPSFLCGDMSALGSVTWWYDWGWADIHGWSGPDYSCPGGRGPPGFVPILRKHEYGKKIWLTEFACPMTSDPNTIKQYMQEVLPRLEAADYVDRYAWFASRFATQDWGPNWLLSSENSLLVPHVSQKTGLGEYYMSI